MRPLEFRAWDNKIKQFHFWSFEKHDVNNIFWDISKYSEIEKPQQFTGLLDKNGVKIFEGDIVKIDTTEEVVKIIYGGHWGCASFGYGGKRKDREDWESEYTWDGINKEACEKYFELIGNVFQNKELL